MDSWGSLLLLSKVLLHACDWPCTFNLVEGNAWYKLQAHPLVLGFPVICTWAMLSTWDHKYECRLLLPWSGGVKYRREWVFDLTLEGGKHVTGWPIPLKEDSWHGCSCGRSTRLGSLGIKKPSRQKLGEVWRKSTRGRRLLSCEEDKPGKEMLKSQQTHSRFRAIRFCLLALSDERLYMTGACWETLQAAKASKVKDKR